MLLPYLPALKAHQRANLVRLLAEQKKWDRVTRETLVALVGDAGADVRAAAVEALLRGTLEKGEAERLESYLNRTSTDLRQGVLNLLLHQTDTDSVASAGDCSAQRTAKSGSEDWNCCGISRWRIGSGQHAASWRRLTNPDTQRFRVKSGRTWKRSPNRVSRRSRAKRRWG